MCDKDIKLGCELCEKICNDEIDISMDNFYEDTYVYLKICRNCDNPACLEACSGDGIHIQKDSNKVVFDQVNCVKCNMCIMVCPFDAIRSNEKYNFTCQSCEKYQSLIGKIASLSEAKHPLLNEIKRDSFAEKLTGGQLEV